MEKRIISVPIIPDGEPIYHEQATIISIVDEAGGEFLRVEQPSVETLGTIQIDTHEWPALRQAIDDMINECRS